MPQKTLNVPSILQKSWNRFKFLYEDADKCDTEYKNGKRRTARDYTYFPWSELDAQFMFAKVVEEQYRAIGSKAEVHHTWDVKNWYRLSDDEKAVLTRSFPKGRKFDMYVSSPYARWEGSDKQEFDAILEFKMYRSWRDNKRGWEQLKPQLESLVEVKRIKMTREVAVVLINRGALNDQKWTELLNNSNSFQKKGVTILAYDTGPLYE